VKAAQYLDGFRHRLRGKKSGAEDALAEARDFPVLVDLPKTPPRQPRNLQAN
jgi:hypothetical protein